MSNQTQHQMPLEQLEPRMLFSALLGGETAFWESGPSEVYLIEGGVSPRAEGAGTTPDLAIGASTDHIHTIWEEMAPGSTLFLVGRENNPLQNREIKLNTGGASETLRKTFAGYDNGGGLPVLTGTYTPTNEIQTNKLKKGIWLVGGISDHVTIKDFVIRNKNEGVVVSGNGIADVIIENVHVYEVKEGFIINGNGDASQITIRDSSVTDFEKRGVRIRDGVRDSTFERVRVDSGGAAYEGDEDFAIGFEVGNYANPSHDLLFKDTLAENSFDGDGSYWNGDGYTAESTNYNITYDGAIAYNSTDGGFDLKGSNITLENTIAIGNRRNYRFWNNTFTVENALSAWSHIERGARSGVYVTNGAVVNINNSTIHNNSLQFEFEDAGGTVNVTNSIVSRGVGREALSGYSLTNRPGDLNLDSSVLQYVSGDFGVDPLFGNAEDSELYGWGGTDDDEVEWNGIGNNFDPAAAAYAGVGYRNQGISGPPVGGVIGEAGTVTVETTGSNDWTTVMLQNQYVNPVVVAGPVSTNGSQPTTVRVRNVAADRFEVQIDEWDYLDGEHVAETVSYLVLEAGRHTLEDGTVIEAGAVSLTDDDFATVGFSSAFDAAPIVLSQVGSTNGGAAVTTRHQGVNANGFQVALQEEEAADQTHATETVGWVAVAAGSGVSGGQRFEAGVTGDRVTDANASIGFATTFGAAPAFFASMQTFDGSDPATVRYRTLDADSASIFIEEEESQDNEVGHTTENVGFFAIEPGDLIGQSDLGGFVLDNTPTPEAAAFAIDVMHAEIATHTVVPNRPADRSYDPVGDDRFDRADTDRLARMVLDTDYGGFNIDGTVNVIGLSILATNFGSPGGWRAGDANGDGVVNIADLDILTSMFDFIRGV